MKSITRVNDIEIHIERPGYITTIFWWQHGHSHECYYGEYPKGYPDRQSLAMAVQDELDNGPDADVERLLSE